MMLAHAAGHISLLGPLYIRLESFNDKPERFSAPLHFYPNLTFLVKNRSLCKHLKRLHNNPMLQHAYKLYRNRQVCLSL